MPNPNSKDFGQLYRAAFAERDPQRKLALLTEVTRTIDQWKQGLENHSSAPVKSPGRASPDVGNDFVQAA